MCIYIYIYIYIPTTVAYPETFCKYNNRNFTSDAFTSFIKVKDNLQI